MREVVSRLVFWPLRLFFAGALAAAAQEPVPEMNAAAAPELDALFANSRGWIGADGDYSVAIDANHTVWLFSDTWIGEIVGGQRANATLINNSIGVQRGAAASVRPEYFYGPTIAGKPTALFQPADGRGWLWPFAGVCVEGRLQVLLWQMEKTAGSDAFGFRNVAVWLAEVANPQEPPSAWQVTQRKLPFTTLDAARRVLFGSGMLRRGDELFIYGIEETGRGSDFHRRLLLARVPVAQVADFSRWRFWNAGVWEEDFTRATPLLDGVATEFSVTFVPALQRFVLITHAPFLSPKIHAHFAAEPWGAWSPATTIYECPEAAWNSGNFCYAGKAHAALSADAELVLSYAANAHQFADVLRDARLYWPKFVRLNFGAPSALKTDGNP